MEDSGMSSAEEIKRRVAQYLRGEVSFQEFDAFRQERGIQSFAQIAPQPGTSTGGLTGGGRTAAVGEGGGAAGPSYSDDSDDDDYFDNDNFDPTKRGDDSEEDDDGNDEEMEGVEEEGSSTTPADTSLTAKYLEGKLSFSEFAELMEKEEDDGKETAVPAVSAQPSKKGVDISEAFSVELALEQEERKGRKRPKRRRINEVPKPLRGLMGEANLRFARGKYDDAIKMCMEVIRQAPHCYEPFQTAAMVYEEKGDMERSLQFALIAAHLNPQDPEEWVKLAEVSLEQNNISQAITCYKKALRYDPNNIGILWEQANLYEQTQEPRKALEGYQQILKLLPEKEGNKYMDLMRDMSKTYHGTGETETAVETMQAAFTKHPTLVTFEDVNMLTELYIAMKQYRQVLEAMSSYCSVQLSWQGGVTDTMAALDMLGMPDTGKQETQVLHCTIPPETPIDLTIKLAVSLVHLRYLGAARPLVDMLLQESAEDMGDLYLDIAEAYVDIGEYDSARPILAMLVNTERYNLAAVWLRYAECLNALGKTEHAVQSYAKVVEMAPAHLGARLSLSALQQQLGRPEEALQALSEGAPAATSTAVETAAQVSSQPGPDVQLLHHKSTLLYSQGRVEDFVDSALLMLSKYFEDSYRQQNLQLVVNKETSRRRKYYLRAMQESSGQGRAGVDVSGKLSSISKLEWWDLFCKTSKSLVKLGRREEVEHLTMAALASPQFERDPGKLKDIKYMVLSACCLNKNYRMAYVLIRPMIMENTEVNQLWNIFSRITTSSEDARHHRFCLRLMIKNPHNIALSFLNGHNSLISGTYKHALGEYVRTYRLDPSNPLSLLLIGLTFFHMASQKYTIKRHFVLVQGMSFLNEYLIKRGETQEAYYNLGRALHQLGLEHLAIHYYQKALHLAPPDVGDSKFSHLLDLRREIAYNLALIYSSSGSKNLAKMLLDQYCVV
ncbi:PREDICTED: general transcription factor 3C polypeptide 3-like [Branchiostoma belcheri]|uniref:General transcription factor 3C polypeptide 3-like n=1 Tax=Branchiostoma belcheri TaxID=7741 RepID=A0A6P5A763_BRABE|nr:PREDICTED: general transcription factor 3C polypeptide 3-like [Branchiostoma belcheri]